MSSHQQNDQNIKEWLILLCPEVVGPGSLQWEIVALPKCHNMSEWSPPLTKFYYIALIIPWWHDTMIILWHTYLYLLYLWLHFMVHFQPIFHSQHIFSLSRTSTTSNGALKNKLIHMYHHSFQLSKFLWKSPRNKCLTMNLPTFLYPWSYRLRTRFHQTNCSYLLSSVMHKLRKWNSLHPIDRYFDRQCKIHT